MVEGLSAGLFCAGGCRAWCLAWTANAFPVCGALVLRMRVDGFFEMSGAFVERGPPVFRGLHQTLNPETPETSNPTET